MAAIMAATRERHATNSSTVDRVWQSLGQMYGSPFAEKFGPAEKNRAGEWADMLGGLRAEQIRGALTKIRNGAMPLYELDLPKFRQLANNTHPAHIEQRMVDTRNKFECFADTLMLNFLMRQPPTSKACLLAMIAAKDRIAQQYALIDSEEHVEPEVMRGSLHEAWGKVWVEALPEEIEEGRRKLMARHGIHA